MSTRSGERGALNPQRVPVDESGVELHADRRGWLAVTRDRTSTSLLIGTDLMVIWATDAVAQLLRWPFDEVVGRSALEFIDASDLDRVAALLDQAVEPDVPSNPDVEHLYPLVRLVRGDGSRVWVQCRTTNLLDDPEVDGILVHLDHQEVGHHRDELITLMAAGAPAEEILEGALRLLDAQVPQATTGISIVADHRVHTLPGRALPLAAVHDLVRPQRDQAAFCWVPTRLGSDDGNHWWIVPARVGRSTPNAYVVVRCDDQMVHNVLMGQDLERTAALLALALERVEQDSRLRHAAEFDALTGLANRRRFDDAVGAAGSSGQPWTVLYVDLDRFKPVNDTYGHAAGDAVLQAIATRLQGCVRPGDLVARIGGDEFAVLVTAAGDRDLPALALRVIGSVERPIALALDVVEVGCSLGIGCAAPGDDPTAVLAAADRDLYARKAHRCSTLVTNAH